MKLKNVLYNIFIRIKTYQSSGLDRNIVDPDGGIHRQRKRLEVTHPEDVSSWVEWPKDGWTCSLDQMPNFQHCFIFEHLAADFEKENKKIRQGAFKSKRDGYALYKAAHVQQVKFNCTSHKEICFFESRIKASMTRNKSYRTVTSLWKSTAKVRSCSCNCKAGAGGRCKHVGALLYILLDYVESELTEIPQDVSCTGKPQQWNKPHSTVTSGSIPIEDLLFTKYNYHDDKMHRKSVRRAQRSIDRRAYDATPYFAMKVNKLQIKTLCENLKSINTPTKPMIIDLLEGNNYKPAENCMIAEKEARYKVHQDHHYCAAAAKRKLRFDDEKITQKQYTEEQTLPGDVLCEPLDSHFCEKKDVISHCETVQCEDFEMSTPDRPPDLDCKCDSVSDVQSEIDISKQLLLTKSDEESQFSDETDLTKSHFKTACSTFVQNLTISDGEIRKI